MTFRFDPAGFQAAVQLELPLPLPAPKASTVQAHGALSPAPSRPFPAVTAARQHRGRMSYLAGLAAEDAVERRYLAAGLTMLERRWRGSRAEIDMIFADGPGLIFVEVKKSRSFDRACESLGRAQCNRILDAASEFLGHIGRSQATEMRFDLALVDDRGALRIMENAFALED